MEEKHGVNCDGHQKVFCGYMRLSSEDTEKVIKPSPLVPLRIIYIAIGPEAMEEKERNRGGHAC